MFSGPFLSLLPIALLPVAGSVTGAMLAEAVKTPRWVVGAALHAAAGVAIALVSVELMPRVLDTTPPWLVALLFGAGAVLSVLLARSVAKVETLADTGGSGKWRVYATTWADLFSDGFMTGATFAVSSGLGTLLAFSQVIANLPGGFATAANLRHRGSATKVRLVAALSYLVPALVGATAGFVLLSDASEAAKDSALALIAGILLVTTIEDLVPQADRPGTKRWISTAAFVGGFVFLTLLSAYV